MSHRIAALAFVILIGVLCIPLVSAALPAAVTLPSGFSDQLVAALGTPTSPVIPTALAFTPDKRLLVTVQTGQVRVIADGALRPTPALDLSTRLCTNNERGLLGIAIDPAFASNHAVYLYYTFKKFGVCPGPYKASDPNNPVNRVSRFTLGANNLIDPQSEVILLDNIPSPGSIHNAGDLHFGQDGYLYISVGDGGCDYAGGSCGGSNNAARDQNVLLGKILRITRDGGIPPSNPFQGAGSARCNMAGRTSTGLHCQETFATGLRNPYRIAFDPNAAGTRFFVNDVGQDTWEEINLGQPGADYGWNVREGFCTNSSTSNCGAPPAGMTNPIYAYQHGSPNNCNGITGAAFVPNGFWPSEYDGAYMFADYVCGRIFSLKLEGASYVATPFVSGMGGSSATALTFGPSGEAQALYYLTYAKVGEVHRIVYTGSANRAPRAQLAAGPAYGPASLTVLLDGRASSDPDSDTLAFVWEYGDGSPGSETALATTSHTYQANGRYFATLRVRDARGALSETVRAQIDVGESPPAVTILAPAASARFRVGQTIVLAGRAVDAQNGTLAPERLSWRIILHHNDHVHPFLAPTPGASVTITAPPPEDLTAALSSYLEIELTATDSAGLTSVTTQELRPRLVQLTFDTWPRGRMLRLGGTAITAPHTILSWEGYALEVVAPDQSDASGLPLSWLWWSDGGAASHAIMTPASATTFVATFRSPNGTLIWLPLAGNP